MGVVAFYISAHQDDWQLFRGRQAWDDVADPRNTVVLIYLTAGDGGRTDGWWEIRERAALESCRLITGEATIVPSVRLFRRHPIACRVCGNTASYFLRLPEGRLTALRDATSAAETIDGSTTYQDWDDLCETVRAILDAERLAAGCDRPWVNAHDYDPTSNPSPPDHPEHLVAGLAVLDATGADYQRAWWAGYGVAFRPANLSEVDTARKRRLFLSYFDSIGLQISARGGTPDDYEAHKCTYEHWLAKEYARRD